MSNTQEYLKLLKEAADSDVKMEIISNASKIHCKFSAMGFLEVLSAIQKLAERIDKLEKCIKSK